MLIASRKSRISEAASAAANSELTCCNGDVVDVDTEAARNNIKTLIDAGSKAVEELAVVARDSQHPRAYEVMAGMLKNLSDMNKDLLELQKRKKDLKEPAKGTIGSNNINVDKAVFVGSTTELLKKLKNESSSEN